MIIKLKKKSDYQGNKIPNKTLTALNNPKPKLPLNIYITLYISVFAPRDRQNTKFLTIDGIPFSQYETAVLHTKQREKETEKAREKTAKKQREWFKRDETRAKQIETVCVCILGQI